MIHSRPRTPEIFYLPLNRNHANRSLGLTLRSQKHSKSFIVEALGNSGVWDPSDDGNQAEKVGPCSCSVGDQAIGDVVGKSGSKDRAVEINRIGSSSTTSKNRKLEVAVAVAATVVLGVGNRVLYKLALVPLKHYPFFLAQLATVGYVLVYFTILHIRYLAGLVTDEMLSLPKAPFLLVGLLEALGAAAGMAAAAILSGASIPILSQTFLVWQILLSIIFLGRRYKVNQLIGCFLVAIGVIITVASGSSANHSVKDASIFWSLLMIFSFLLQAADTVLKEFIFRDTARQLKGGSVDLFVVNSYGSAFQVGCDGAPLLPLLFVLVNMGFNISLLHLLKISSAVVSSLASTFSVPISVYVFTLPLPYLGIASTLPTGFVAGAHPCFGLACLCMDTKW
ncbi:hypothetical protein GH714_042294 [Hevea brasiliensis]|uniref:Uncharacterized protein n=1 Tax=Hevea brasiliensis TaxID=3981 RepID=A0A6A6KSG3_HEVBR|nr:hypothetical protein GH714_042294 [Hevea brasiliensis]